MTRFRPIGVLLALLATPISPAADFADDVGRVVEWVPRLYPGYATLGDQITETVLQQATEATDPASQYLTLARYLAAIGDEHLVVVATGELRRQMDTAALGWPGFSLAWDPLADQWQIASVAESTALRVGDRILTIDEQPISGLVQEYIDFIPADEGRWEVRKSHLTDRAVTRVINYFDLHYWLRNPATAVTSLTVLRGGKLAAAMVPTLSFADYLAFFAARIEQPDPIELQRIANGQATLIARSFHVDYAAARAFDYRSALQTMFERIEASNIQALTIDLRGNEGGGQAAQWLMAHLMTKPFRAFDRVAWNRAAVLQAVEAGICQLAPQPLGTTILEAASSNITPALWGALAEPIEYAPADPVFSGPVRVRVDHRTGSRATGLATLLARAGRAEVIGIPGSRADYSVSGGYCVLQLPASGLSITVPLLRKERVRG